MMFHAFAVIKLLTVILIPSCVVTEDVNTSFCSGQCERTTANNDEGRVLNYALLGHTFSILPTTNPYICHYNCFMECRCLSYQISSDGCELLDEDRLTKPTSFQARDGYTYHDIQRQYRYNCSNAKCQNGCCKSRPCLNGGRCLELCENRGQKFNCTCAEGFTGKLCEIKRRSCKDYIGNDKKGSYVILDKERNKLKVFCDFQSENGFAWTLIESFSFQNNPQLLYYGLMSDHPLNEDNPNWELYRLSYLHMKDIADVSTHFRATCQFPYQGVKHVDYVRGRLSDTDVIEIIAGHCFKYEYINIRGHQCHNCTAYTGQNAVMHLHVDGFFRIHARWGNFQTRIPLEETTTLVTTQSQIATIGVRLTNQLLHNGGSGDHN